ncbi:unnamed protein product [Auanema sp. JU1783]|nr:unnamed protein product [Auanema sp. JU1783]
MKNLIFRQQEKVIQALGQHNIPGLRWLLEGFNYYDVQRVKDVGPDRAAAEWIVRCGGSITFDKIDDSFSDYNALIKRTAELDPRLPQDNVKLTDIDASHSSVTGFGCRHFKGLSGLQNVRFAHCKNLHDFGLETMGEHVGGHLKSLELGSCRRISEFGLAHLKLFKKLEVLKLYDLTGVYKISRSLDQLHEALPNTDIKYSEKNV